ncbi:hypothetical protein [Ulvibacter antarcticus]|uniref:Tetratricopeptide repeat protein n=1 Tax=Ulvibacter antarcticus TaxID=442714 RepID=A0A3L9Y986_9FLAO|nr:hypothetical protein [Ulvibacter antarcticus]RMA57266.1 hypothetical protein BXY75_3153 [Ulvibacter antarcticus]
MEEQNYIAFEEYLSEEMSTEERLTFEAQLSTDESLRKSFETYKEFSSYLEHKFEHEEATLAFKENLKQISEKHFSKESVTETETTSEEKTIVRSFKPWQYAIAASVMLLIGMTLFNQFSTPTFGDYNQYDAVSLTMRGEGDELINNAENAFNERNFKDASVYFESLTLKDSTNTEYQLYYAISLLETNFFEKADAIFETLSEENSAFKYQAVWHHALSKLKQEKNMESMELLKQIPEDAEMYKKAQKLLKKLK